MTPNLPTNGNGAMVDRTDVLWSGYHHTATPHLVLRGKQQVQIRSKATADATQTSNVLGLPQSVEPQRLEQHRRTKQEMADAVDASKAPASI